MPPEAVELPATPPDGVALADEDGDADGDVPGLPLDCALDGADGVPGAGEPAGDTAGVASAVALVDGTAVGEGFVASAGCQPTAPSARVVEISQSPRKRLR